MVERMHVGYVYTIHSRQRNLVCFLSKAIYGVIIRSLLLSILRILDRRSIEASEVESYGVSWTAMYWKDSNINIQHRYYSSFT
jgi:hypothetical protein